MDKLYIPISSLNFNNIIATESISPKSFYQNRKFGYKRFYSVNPNPFEDILLGYSKIPNFSIDDTDLDDYPLVIEVSTDLLPQNKYTKEQKNDIAIYKVFNTIYFDPTKTKFYFSSEKEKDICLIKVAPSIETKLMPIYQNNIKIIDKNNTFLWNENILKDISDTQKHTTDNDLYINRLKGFYYCYYLGILLTKIKNKNLVKEYPKKEIEKLLLSANNNGLSDKFIENMEKSLKNLQTANERYKKFNIYFIVDINNYKITNFQDDILDKENNEIYRNIINDLIIYPTYNIQSFLDEKVDLVLKMGENFKESFNIKWNGSQEQNYINGLLDNLESYQPFNLKNIDNEVLKAISLFIFKGDDIEKLYNALQKENIKDYRLAFGLWGALFGFSSIPKTISNILFEEKIKNMIDIQKILKDMYKKIHNFDIQEDINIDFIQEKIIVSKDIKKQKDNITQQYNNDIPKCPKCSANMTKKLVQKGKFKGYEFFGCINYPQCKGKRDLQGNELDNNFESVNNSSIVSKMVDYVKKPFSSNTNLDNIIYDFIKDYPNGVKVSEAKKVIKVKRNKEFKEKYKHDNRFEFFKDKNTEMIRTK